MDQNEKARKIALLSLEGFLYTRISREGMKYVGHRHRPQTGDCANTWNGPNSSFSDVSFPSGHVSSAFAVATVIASDYHDSLVILILAYVIVSLTALSRINDNQHWASDVFFDSAVGYFVARSVVGLHNNKYRNLTIHPAADGKNFGLST